MKYFTAASLLIGCWGLRQVSVFPPIRQFQVDQAPCGEHLSLQGSTRGEECWECVCADAEWYDGNDGNASDRWTTGCESLPVGMAAGMYYGSVTVITLQLSGVYLSVEGLLLWSPFSLCSIGSEMQIMLSLLFSCSEAHATRSAYYHGIFECSVTRSSLLAFQKGRHVVGCLEDYFYSP